MMTLERRESLCRTFNFIPVSIKLNQMREKLKYLERCTEERFCAMGVISAQSDVLPYFCAELMLSFFRLGDEVKRKICIEKRALFSRHLQEPVKHEFDALKFPFADNNAADTYKLHLLFLANVVWHYHGANKNMLGKDRLEPKYIRFRKSILSSLKEIYKTCYPDALKHNELSRNLLIEGLIEELRTATDNAGTLDMSVRHLRHLSAIAAKISLQKPNKIPRTILDYSTKSPSKRRATAIRNASVNAMAQAYKECFGSPPVTTLNSDFEHHVRWMFVYAGCLPPPDDDDEKYTPTLNRLIKKAIQLVKASNGQLSHKKGKKMR